MYVCVCVVGGGGGGGEGARGRGRGGDYFSEARAYIVYSNFGSMLNMNSTASACFTQPHMH